MWLPFAARLALQFSSQQVAIGGGSQHRAIRGV